MNSIRRRNLRANSHTFRNHVFIITSRSYSSTPLFRCTTIISQLGLHQLRATSPSSSLHSKAPLPQSSHGSRRTLTTDSRARLSTIWAPTGGLTPQINPSTGQEDSHSLLLRGGFIRQAAAGGDGHTSGLYQYLPLGLRVQEKACALLDKHMRSIGASKVELSTLSAVELWEQSGRWKTKTETGVEGDTSTVSPTDRMNEFFSLKDRKGARFLLNPTHEEEITRLVADAVHSPRDLPLRLYQITRKYRDELRPRQGLLRTREFLMKDLYTFDVNRQAAVEAYEAVKRAYNNFFDEFGIPYLVANADSGNIGGDFSHEYHFVSEKGEDTVYTCDDCGLVANEELLDETNEKTEDHEHSHQCPECGERGGKMKAHKTVELGHTFFLGTKYSEPLNARVTIAKPQEHNADTPMQGSSGDATATTTVPLQMGCYGIGVSRLIATMADLQRDSAGLLWPKPIAPYTVCIVPAPGHEEDAAVVHDILGMVAPSAGCDPIIDDRRFDSSRSALPWKLKDADLVGYPVLVVLGRSWKTSRRCEVQCRRLNVKQDVDLADLVTVVRELLEKL